jgi:putative Ca2+/H+ antiporter (TMEM165/GDT1 family)
MRIEAGRKCCSALWAHSSLVGRQLAANLAAKYHAPLSVGIGATLGLWAVGLLAILGGKTLLKVLPIKWITRHGAQAIVH